MPLFMHVVSWKLWKIIYWMSSLCLLIQGKSFDYGNHMTFLRQRQHSIYYLCSFRETTCIKRGILSAKFQPFFVGQLSCERHLDTKFGQVCPHDSVCTCTCLVRFLRVPTPVKTCALFSIYCKFYVVLSRRDSGLCDRGLELPSLNICAPF